MILSLLPPPYSWPDGLFTGLYCSAVIQGCVKRRGFISRQTDLRKHLASVDQTLDNRLFNIHRLITIQQISVRETNRPFYRYGGHIELIRFKENYGMSRGHDRDPIYSLSIYARFSGQFFSKFSEKKILMGKKIVVPCLDVLLIAFFPRNTKWSSLFRVDTERVPPGQPIILLKSNKFNRWKGLLSYPLGRFLSGG